MKLARNVHGEAGGGRPPLLVAHGLFGSGRNWGVVAKRLADDRQVVVVDMRNHGESQWADEHDYPALARDLAETAGELGAPVDLVGHSMGGKAAMVLALALPELVRRLVVVDIAPVAYGHSQAELIVAMRAVDLARIERRSDADAALAESVPEPGVRAFLLQSLDIRERRWRLNLDALQAQMERITGWPEVAGRFEGPALFLSGAASDYLDPEHHERILALFPAARFEAVEGAGHWVHAEQPRRVEAAIRAFLD